MIRDNEKIFHDTKWNIIDFTSSIIISFVLMRFIISILGIDGFGFYSLFTSLIATFGLVDIGMGIAVSKYLSEYLNSQKYSEANQVIIIAVLFYIIIGTVVFGITFLLRNILVGFLNLGEEYFNIATVLIIIVPIIMTTNFLSQVAISVLVAFEKWEKIAKLNILFKMIYFIVTLLLLMFNENNQIFMNIFISNMIISIFKLAIYVFISKKEYSHFYICEISKLLVMNVVSFLKYTLLQFSFSTLLGHLDNLIITKFIGLEALGLYLVVLNVITYLHRFFTNVFKIIFPKLSMLHGKKDYDLMNKSVKNYLKISTVLSLFVSIVMIITWRNVIGYFLGSTLVINTFNYLKIFLVYFIVRTPEVIYYYFFNAIAFPKIFVYTTFLESLVNFSLYLILIPSYGVMGIIISHVISKFLSVLLMFFYYGKITKSLNVIF